MGLIASLFISPWKLIGAIGFLVALVVSGTQAEKIDKGVQVVETLGAIWWALLVAAVNMIFGFIF